MSDDPFAEPTDSDRTIVRPRPSGVASGFAGVPQGPASPMPSGDVRPLPKTGSNPLVAAASPVLAAAVRMSADASSAPDIDRLRRAMIEAVRRFQTEALATGLDPQTTLYNARYALCATVDDLVLNTPWGRNSNWARQSITSTFHTDVTGGERFFDILENAQKDLGNQLPLVELMYLCLSLGFMGQYRVLPRGATQLSELREGVYRTIRQRRGDFERELSPRWRGIAAGSRSLAQRVPLWAIGLGALGTAALMFVVFTFLLAGISDVAFAELFGLPPHGQITVPRAPLPAGTRPFAASAEPVPAAPPSSLTARLRQFLAPEIQAGLVTVLQDAQTVTVRVANRNMFSSGTAVLASSYLPLMERIGDALNVEPGEVSVFGYTDDQKIRTVRFPSNFELSQARADAAAALLRIRMKEPGRMHAKGKGDNDPIASNATPDGRQQNRRTEIVLVRPSDAM